MTRERQQPTVQRATCENRLRKDGKGNPGVRQQLEILETIAREATGYPREELVAVVVKPRCPICGRMEGLKHLRGSARGKSGSRFCPTCNVSFRTIDASNLARFGQSDTPDGDAGPMLG